MARTKPISRTIPHLIRSPLAPDGVKVAFCSDRDGKSNYIMNADGSNPTRVTTIQQADHIPRWAPTGRRSHFGPIGT